jgi:hypothetical protein
MIKEEKPACDTCSDTGEIYEEGQIGAPGSGGTRPCPDCVAPRPASQYQAFRRRWIATNQADHSQLIEQLAAFLRKRFEEGRAVAVAASACKSWVRNGVTLNGEHWEWSGSHDEKIVIDPDAYLRGALNVLPNGQYTGLGLWSEEQYSEGPNDSYPLGHLVLSSDDEVDVAVGDHIVRQSPACVIADIDAKLAMLTMLTNNDSPLDRASVAALLYQFAARYARHPEYSPEWGRILQGEHPLFDIEEVKQ